MNLALFNRYVWLIALIGLCACAHIDPTNPYDPDLDPESRAQGSLYGTLSATEFLEFFDYSQVEIQIDRQIQQEGVESISYYTLANQKGEFSFSQIEAGVYTLTGTGEFRESNFKIEPTTVLIYQDQTVQKSYFLRRSELNLK
jgi:hypothetical protein